MVDWADSQNEFFGVQYGCSPSENRTGPIKPDRTESDYGQNLGPKWSGPFRSARPGTHLKNLRTFSVYKFWETDRPLDNGIRALLTGCNKLETLDIKLGGLTDMGLGYIGKYGHNLKHLSLKCIGESDAGLVELSKGCRKLRSLRMKDCPFSEQALATFMLNMHSLRYICVQIGYRIVSALTRPDFEL
nr:hypothetical protein [Tanacetum cinerariifolium]